MRIINLATASLTIIALNATLYAQKQPQIQLISIRAPENIKIDGKLDEWTNFTLSAYNSINRIFYTVSNDDNNLYFAIRGVGNGVAKKAIAGGMVLTVSKAVEKNDRKDSNDKLKIIFPLPQNGKTVASIMGVVNQVSGYNDDVKANKKQIDSIVVIANELMNKALNEIGISGVKNISDSVISRYNEYGIKAAAQFNKMQPIIELCIPLKYLKVSIDNLDKIRYNIKLNAVPDQSSGLTQTIAPENVTPNVGYALNPTDFWGEYILAKKQ